MNRNLTGTVTVAQTWGGQSWTTITIRGIALAAGAHVLRHVTGTGGYAINSMTATLGQPAADGNYVLTNRSSGKVLDVGGGSTADGATVIQRPSHGGYNQQWNIKPLGGGFYCLVNRNSGKLVDINGGSQADNASVIQWPSNGGSNQQWSLTLR